jgi:2-dehydro-3-deoxygluconokinase
MTYTIICIGEPLAELSRGGSDLGVAFGGDTLNTAIYCARSVQGRDIAVHYVSAIGEDVLSDSVLELMERECVGTRYVTRDPQRQIGIYAIRNDETGERQFHYWRGASAAREMFKTGSSPHLDAIRQADLAYLSGISLAILTQDARGRLRAALAERRKAGMKLAFDSNYRPSLWEDPAIARREIASFWEITDIALPSQEDEAALFGKDGDAAILSRLSASGAKTGALKCGAGGPVGIPPAPAGQVYPPAGTVIDTTGAGDSFNGAYLAALSCGASQAEALGQAHDLARRVVAHQGAILPQQTPAPLRRVGSAIRLRPENLAEYKRLHADVWPAVLQRLRDSNFTNYSIYLKQPECLMFGYFEYTGQDFAADSAAIAADPVTQDWWALCGPMQDPFETRADGEWWAEMEEVFHMA